MAEANTLTYNNIAIIRAIRILIVQSAGVIDMKLVSLYVTNTRAYYNTATITTIKILEYEPLDAWCQNNDNVQEL